MILQLSLLNIPWKTFNKGVGISFKLLEFSQDVRFLKFYESAMHNWAFMAKLPILNNQ